MMSFGSRFPVLFRRRRPAVLPAAQEGMLDGEGDPGEGDPGEGDPGEGDPGEGDPGEGDPGEGDPGEGDPGEEGTLFGLSGAAQLMSTAAFEGLSNPFDSAQGGWINGPAATDPFTNIELVNGMFNAFLGRNVDPFTNAALDTRNANAYTGDMDVEPFTGSGGVIERDKIDRTPDLNKLAQQIEEHALTSDSNAALLEALENRAQYDALRDDKPFLNPYDQSPSLSASQEGERQTSDDTALAASYPQPNAGPSALQQNGEANSRLPVQASLAGAILDQAVRSTFVPRDAFGNPLQGQLNLYTGGTARGLAEAASIPKAPTGYLISNTKYYGPAQAAEDAELLSRGLPRGARIPQQDVYDQIWGTASRLAVRDAALSGSVATHNDLATLPPKSIQSVYELPTLRKFGGAAGGLGVVTGAVLIYGGTQQNNTALKGLGIVAGLTEVAGGAALVVGSLKTIAPLQRAGRSLGTAGALLTAPLTAHSFYNDLATGNWFDAVVDATSVGSAGLTFGGALAGSAALTEGGLVLGSFGIGVLVGTGIDKGFELATKGVLGVDLSPSAIIAGELTVLDRVLTYFWSDPSQPAYTQSIAWKLLQWSE